MRQVKSLSVSLMISILLSDEPEHLGQISIGLPGEPSVMPASKMGILEMEPVTTGKGGG